MRVDGPELINLELKSDVERANKARDPNYCGSCYGASAPESGYVQSHVICPLNVPGILQIIADTAAAATAAKTSDKRIFAKAGPSATRRASSSV